MADWIYEKFKGDMAIYATCPRCNYTHHCGDALNGELEIKDSFIFCPLCGEFLYSSEKEIDVAYNVRDITDLYTTERDMSVIEHALEEARKNDTKQSN